MRLLLTLALLAPVMSPAATKIVLVAGTPSHGPGEHEFNAGILLLEKCLKQTKHVQTVVVKGGWPEDESVFKGAKSIVFYLDGGARHPFLEGQRLETLRGLMKNGVGMALLHYAVEIPKEKGGPELMLWTGGFYDRPYSQNPINDVKVTRATPGHPISRGWHTFSGRDEWYYKIRFKETDERVTPILTTLLPVGNPGVETIAWARGRTDGGRGFGFTGGHYHQNWGIADFRQMITNAVLWTAKVHVPRKGAPCRITEEDLKQNLDPKPARKKK